MNTLAIWKGLPVDVRLYTKRLSDYFKTELGELLLENLYLSTILRAQQMAHQQSGAAFIFSQSSSLLGQKSRCFAFTGANDLCLPCHLTSCSLSIGRRSNDDTEVRL